eukprot:3870446-Rhodomonas_salina.2
MRSPVPGVRARRIYLSDVLCTACKEVLGSLVHAFGFRLAPPFSVVSVVPAEQRTSSAGLPLAVFRHARCSPRGAPVAIEVLVLSSAIRFEELEATIPVPIAKLLSQSYAEHRLEVRVLRRGE